MMWWYLQSFMVISRQTTVLQLHTGIFGIRDHSINQQWRPCGLARMLHIYSKSTHSNALRVPQYSEGKKIPLWSLPHSFPNFLISYFGHNSKLKTRSVGPAWIVSYMVLLLGLLTTHPGRTYSVSSFSVITDSCRDRSQQHLCSHEVAVGPQRSCWYSTHTT